MRGRIGRIYPLFSFFYGNELWVFNVARVAGGSFTIWNAMLWYAVVVLAAGWCYQLCGYIYCTAVLAGCCCGVNMERKVKRDKET
jgi:hypothetical protein